MPDPYALYHQRLWYLWYTGGEGPRANGHSRIGGSDSADGRRWLGHRSALDGAGLTAPHGVAEPAVVRNRTRNLWLMAYAAGDRTWALHLAASIDLLTWSRVGVLIEPWATGIDACRTPRLLWFGDN